jgi:hypothetical protein
MLTKRQLKQIEEIIRRRFLAFTYEALGERALSEEEIAELKRIGLLRGSVRSMVADGYTIGKVVSALEHEDARAMGFDEILAAAKKIPTTAVEKQMIEWSSSHAGEYIKGISDSMVKEIRGTAARGALQAIREKVEEGIKDRLTPSQLKTALFDTIDDKARDWGRIASTELTNSIQNGIANEIRRIHGSEQLVYKRPNPDACKYCKAAFLEDDGITPKVFKLSDMEDHNFGKRVADWEPTISAVHPWCQCQLMMIPEGYDFVQKRTVKAPFAHDGKNYKRGQVVADEVFDALSEDSKQKTKLDAILEYTGETATPSVKKSLGSDMGHEHGEDCTCGY